MLAKQSRQMRLCHLLSGLHFVHTSSVCMGCSYRCIVACAHVRSGTDHRTAIPSPTMVGCQSGWNSFSCCKHFSLIVISPSYPVLLCLPCRVLTELFCPRTTWVYPSPPLQTLAPLSHWVYPNPACNTPVHILGLSHHVQHRLTLIWFNPDHSHNKSLHTNTHILKYLL